MNAVGPLPPNVKAIAWAGELQWLFVLWAFWIDRNRTVKRSNNETPGTFSSSVVH